MAETKLTTGKVRLSYANIWKPKAMAEGQEAKYSVSLLIPKSDTKTVNAIKAAIKAADLGAGLAKNGVVGGDRQVTNNMEDVATANRITCHQGDYNFGHGADQSL